MTKQTRCQEKVLMNAAFGAILDVALASEPCALAKAGELMKTIGQIVVATALRPDVDERPLLFASDFAHRFNFDLRLVHALDLLRFRPWLVDVGERLELSDLERLTTEAARHEAEAALEEVARRLRQNDDVSIAAIDAGGMTVADALASAAAAGDAVMIVAGALTARPRLLQSGLTTLFGLVSRSPLPVLVLGEESAVDFSRSEMRILLADDLSPDCDEAVRTAFALATAAGTARLVHVHVLGKPAEHSETLRRVQSLLARVLERDIEHDEVVEGILAKRRAQLAARAETYLTELRAAGGSYETRLVTGSPAERLADVAAEVDADLVIVGRHRSVHLHPLSMGQVPLVELLGLRAATIVVPWTPTRLPAALMGRVDF